MRSREVALAVVDRVLARLLARQPTPESHDQTERKRMASAWGTRQRVELAVVAAEHGASEGQIEGCWDQAAIDSLHVAMAQLGGWVVLAGPTVPPMLN